MVSILDPLFGKEKFCLCIVIHSIKAFSHGSPLLAAQVLFNISFRSFQNARWLLICSCALPLFLSEFAELWNLCCLLGTEGRLVPWLVSVGWQDWQGYRHLCLHSMGSCKRQGSVCPFSKAVCNQVLKQENNYSCPGPRGQNQTVGKNTSSCLFSSGWGILWWEYPLQWKRILVNQEKEIVTAFQQCCKSFIFCQR